MEKENQLSSSEPPAKRSKPSSQNSRIDSGGIFYIYYVCIFKCRTNQFYIRHFNQTHSYFIVDVTELTLTEINSYEENVEQLTNELSKDHTQTGKVKRLIKKTFMGRRQWIKTDRPSVSDVLGTFPLLKKSLGVSIV